MPAAVPTPAARRASSSALAAIIGAAAVFSWGFVIVKSIPLPPAVIAFWRIFIAVVVLSTVATIWRVPWPKRWPLVIAAGVAFGAHQLIFIPAVQLTSIAVVTTAAATQPFWVMLISRRAVGERADPIMFLCSALAVGGVAIVVTANLDDASRSWQGDLLAVVNIVAFTSYFLLAKRARTSGAPTLTFTAGSQFFALCLVTPAMFIFTSATSVTPDLHAFALLALLALGPGNGHLIVNWAHPHISAALSSLALAAVPLLASIWAYLVLDEPFTARHALGMVAVAIAIAIGRRRERPDRAAPSDELG